MSISTHHPTGRFRRAQAQGPQEGVQLPRVQARQAEAPPPALPVKTLVAAVVFVAAITFGDAAVAAAIAGVFSVINTVMNVWISRRIEHTRRTLGAPRRAVYDADGRMLGTVIEIDAPAEPDKPRRRLADHGQQL